MKLSLILFLLCFSLMAVVACRKDKVEPTVVVSEVDEPFIDTCDTSFTEIFTSDTIYPSDYLMTYPGSSWEYDNGSVTKSTNWVSFPVCSISKPDCYQVEQNYVTLPNLGSRLIHSDAYIGNNPTLTGTWYNRQIGGYVGELIYSHTTYSDNSSTQYRTVYKAQHNSLEVDGVVYFDVMEVELTNSIYKGTVLMAVFLKRNYFYAKDVGMIRRITRDSNFQFDTLNLVNYYIAPH